MMDILGAIAIGTEPYFKDKEAPFSKRISRKENIIKLEMFRNILVQGAYQIIVLMVLMYFGGFFFFEQPFNLVLEPLRRDDGSGSDKLTLNTICFHAFFMMNWFNTLNSRILDANEMNVLKSICNNHYFFLIMAVELIVQHLMIRAGSTVLGSALLGTNDLSAPQKITCWLLGLFSLVVHVAGKQISLETFSFFENLELDNENEQTLMDRCRIKYDDLYQKLNSRMKEADD